MILTGLRNFDFLIWNLFLAWMPYVLSLWIVSLCRSPQRRWWSLPFATIAWALFLPNAPYIMTDFGHLLHPRRFPFMYDMVTIFAFAWTGLLLGLTSLHLLQKEVRGAWGKLAAGTFVLGATLMTGMGIYLGRFLRWNSWDILRRPGRMWRGEDGRRGGCPDDRRQTSFVRRPVLISGLSDRLREVPRCWSTLPAPPHLARGGEWGGIGWRQR